MLPDRPLTRLPQAAPPPVDPGAQLRFIRETMAQAGRPFTAVPGKGSMVIGALALVVAWVAHRQTEPTAWLGIWLAAAVLAVGIGGWAMVRKSARSGVPLPADGMGRKFILGQAPPFIAGAILTGALYRTGRFDLMPGMWLLLFGAGMTTGGAYSIRLVPLQGMATMALGTLCLLAPTGWGDGFMAAGFGGLFLIFGYLIARYHGG